MTLRVDAEVTAGCIQVDLDPQLSVVFVSCYTSCNSRGAPIDNCCLTPFCLEMLSSTFLLPPSDSPSKLIFSRNIFKARNQVFIPAAVCMCVCVRVCLSVCVVCVCFCKVTCTRT